MSEDNYYKVKRLEARIDQLEGFCHELSNYVAEMQQNETEAHDLLVKQVNTFMHETIVKMKELEDRGE